VAPAPVFASVHRGLPLTERAVNYIIKDAAKRAGVKPAASVHWLRRVHARHAIDNGAPITLVSATLEHFLDGLLTTGRGENSLPGAPLSGRRSGTMPSYYA
jgi:site-specific recombinase XerD